LLAGCGGGGSASSGTTSTATEVDPPHARLAKATLKQPAGCFLTVFLSESHTTQQQRHVELLLLGNKLIREISFVSKDLALRRLARTQPQIAKGMHVNPFPDSYEVLPGSRNAVFSIMTDFAAGVDGVTNVKPSRGCGAAS
jgi:cell division protein FtsX